jgi:signal transduction histidine kinase
VQSTLEPIAHEPRRFRNVLGSMRFRIVTSVVVLLAASAGVSIFTLRADLLEHLDEEITIDLRQEMEEFELLAGGLDPRTSQPFGADVESIFDIYFAREVADEGETLLAFVGDEIYHTDRAAASLSPEQIGDAITYWLSLEAREEGRISTSLGEVRYVALPFREGSSDGLFVVANFPAFEQSDYNDAIVAQATTQGAMIIVASIIGLGLAGRVLRPLRSLADTAQTITATDLTRRIPVHGKDEASRIALTFNEMLERLEAVFATQRQFLDDASHELRVPLTVVRGNVEVLEMETDPEERAAMVTVITNEIERMNRIVEDLLLLARSERPGFLAIDTVDLAELISDIHRKAQVLCRRDWHLEESPSISIRADGQRLTQALMQLAQNACQHTEEGSPVRMGARLENGSAVLWVHDSGTGVLPQDIERVFQRYVRGSDKAAGSGLGLGLSIVAAIASAHGGVARISPDTKSGAQFEIILPLVPAESLEPVRV